MNGRWSAWLTLLCECGGSEPEKYSPPCFQPRHYKGVGLVEPLLFKIPLIRHFLYAMGNALPASREVMTRLMKSKMPLGLLPGGSEEIIISQSGKERVFIKERKVGEEGLDGSMVDLSCRHLSLA